MKVKCPYCKNIHTPILLMRELSLCRKCNKYFPANNNKVSETELFLRSRTKFSKL